LIVLELNQFDFDAALINYTPDFDAEHLDLLGALGNVPALLICTASLPAAFLATLAILVKLVAPDAVVVALDCASE
jgi:hypothetical protein